jgi:hypothetical protein
LTRPAGFETTTHIRRFSKSQPIIILGRMVTAEDADFPPLTKPDSLLESRH